MKPGKFRFRPFEVEAIQVDVHDYDGMIEILGWIKSKNGFATAVDYDNSVIEITGPDIDEAESVGHGGWVVYSNYEFDHEDGFFMTYSMDEFAVMFTRG